MEWLEKFFSDKATLTVMFLSGFIGFLGGIPQGIIQKKHDGWGGFFSAIIIGIVVSLIVGLGIKDHVASEAFRIAIVGASAVISQDIWAGLRALGRLISQDPLGAMSRLIAALRGQYVPPTAPSAPPASPTVSTLRPMPPPDSLGER